MKLPFLHVYHIPKIKVINQMLMDSLYSTIFLFFIVFNLVWIKLNIIPHTLVVMNPSASLYFFQKSRYFFKFICLMFWWASSESSKMCLSPSQVLTILKQTHFTDSLWSGLDEIVIFYVHFCIHFIIYLFLL